MTDTPPPFFFLAGAVAILGFIPSFEDTYLLRVNNISNEHNNINRLNYTRGWLVGNFNPSIYKTKDFEIGVLEHKKNENTSKLNNLWKISQRINKSGIPYWVGLFPSQLSCVYRSKEISNTLCDGMLSMLKSAPALLKGPSTLLPLKLKILSLVAP